jgi:sigma-B regulation protein RsbU (phosphoserine phosphatase)
MVLGQRAPLRTPDLLSDPRFPALARSSGQVRAALVVPLLAEDEPIGVLAATDMRPGRAWTDHEERLLVAIATHCGAAIERARLRQLRAEVEELRRHEEAMGRENRFAAEIQRHLLPDRPLRLKGWEVAGRLVPAAHVGGDGFDYRRLGDHRLCVTVSDVEGTGIPAAILMVSVQMLLREVFTGEWSIEEAVRHLSRDLAEAHSHQMVTLVAAELDASSGMLRYHRAGNPYPIVRRRDGRLLELETGGPPFGLGVEVPVEVGHVQLEPGDAVLFFSDGVSEALDDRKRMFKEAGLDACWQGLAGLSPSDAVERVMRAAMEFRTYPGHDDDVTAVVLAAPSQA